MIYVIDANPFVWGIKKVASEGQEDNIRKAEEFFKWADYHKHTILIPTLVVAEVLVCEPEEEVVRYLKIIREKFFVAQFDIKVARIYSRILFGRLEKIKSNCKVLEITRQQMKVDHIIVATAVSNKADIIISHDNGVKAFSEGFLKVEELRETYKFGDQQSLTLDFSPNT